MPTLSLLTFGTFCDIKLSLIIAKKFLSRRWNVIFITNSLPKELVIKHKNIKYVMYDMSKYINLSDSNLNADPTFGDIFKYVPMIWYIHTEIRKRIAPCLEKADYVLVHYPALIFNNLLTNISNMGIFYVAPAYITSDIPYIFSKEILNLDVGTIGSAKFSSSASFTLKLSLISGNPYNLRNILQKAQLFAMWDKCILKNITSVKPIEHLSNIVDTSIQKHVIPDVLDNFVSSKPLLVYISFGSFKISKSLVLQIIQALLNQGYRVIYHGKLDAPIQHENLLIYTTFISHEWLIPKCSMIVSSGSYCMTSIANYHGVPIVHVPILLEQVLWAKLYAYNTSTKYIHHQKRYKIKTLENLVNKIHNSPKVKEYTRKLALSVQKNKAVTKLYTSIKNKIL